jgi:hypothetical protein
MVKNWWESVRERMVYMREYIHGEDYFDRLRGYSRRRRRKGGGWTVGRVVSDARMLSPGQGHVKYY